MIVDEGPWGHPWGSPKRAKTTKMAKIHFLMGISGNGKVIDGPLGKVKKIHIEIYNIGDHDY